MDLTSSRSSWFAPGLRTKTAPGFEDLFELDLRNVQKAAYDESGEDVRLKWSETGSRWSSLSERRRWFVRECQEKMEESFDKLYEHFAENKRLSQGWYMYLMPTMKTPSLRKYQSRVQQMQGDSENKVEPVTSKPLSLEEASKPEEEVTTESLISGEATESTSTCIVDVTNTVVRKSTRSSVKKRSVPNKENSHESLPAAPATTNPRRTTRACTRKPQVTTDVVVDDLKALPATTKKRTTRARTKKAEKDSASQGLCRSRIESTTAVASTESERERPDPASVSKPPTADHEPQSSSTSISTTSAEADQNPETSELKNPGIPQSRQRESDDTPSMVISPPRIRESTGRGPSRRSCLKTLGEVVIEKLQVSSPAIETSIPPTSLQPMETDDATTGDQTSVPVPVTSDILPAVRRSVRLRKVAPGEVISCTSDTDDESYIRPPPPKRSLLKLKKKGGRKGKKALRNVVEDPVKTESQTSSGESAVVVPSQPKSLASSEEESSALVGVVTEHAHESNADASATKSQVDVSKQVTEKTLLSGVQSSKSNETMYESCISEVEISTPSKSAAKKSNRIPKRAAKAAKVRGRIKTPVGASTQLQEHTPTAVTRTPKQASTQLQEHTPTAVTRTPKQASTQPQEHTPTTVTRTPKQASTQLQEHTPTTVTRTPKQPYTPHTPGTYTRPRPVLSPMDVPYMNKTPRILRQLHEEHQVRSGGKIISLAELRSRNSPAPCHSSKKGGTPGFPHSPQVTCTKATVFKAKRLRSVSMERLPEELEAKRPLRGGVQCQACPLEEMDAMHSTEETETTESDGSQEKDSTPSASSDSVDNYSPDEIAQGNPNHNEDSLPQSESSQSGQPKSASKMDFIWNLFTKKGEGSKLTAAGGSTQLPMSFLPRNSPMKQDLFEVRQQKLVEKVQRKKEDEDRRKRELEAKRQQELQDKIKRREERAKRVAEKQAVLAREEQERRKRMEGQRMKDELFKKEKFHQKKAKEFEQKTKKQKERMQAAEIRRHQEEEQKLQRLYQLQEERRMQEELTKKRMEQEEEEKRVRRVERQKAEQERQLQREAEREAEQRRRIEEERLQAKEARHLQEELESKRQQEAVRKQQEYLRKEEEKKKFEMLLHVGGHAKPTVNPTQVGNTANRFIEQWKQLRANANEGTSITATVTKSKNPPSKKHQSPEEPEESIDLMNSTFTIEAKQTVVTPAPNSNNKPNYAVVSSYEMTPIQQQDPFSIYENYNIGDLGSDDSTDEEDCPKKVIPPWAHPTELGKLMQSQENKVDSRVLNIQKIFPPDELLLAPDLARIFKHKRKRFYHRSSSARWDSPMLKKSRVI